MQAPRNRVESDYACRLGPVQSYCRFRGSCNRVRSVDLPFRLRLVQIHAGFLEAGKRRMQFAAGLCRFIVGSAEPVTGSAIQTSHSTFQGGPVTIFLVGVFRGLLSCVFVVSDLLQIPIHYVVNRNWKLAGQSFSRSRLTR